MKKNNAKLSGIRVLDTSRIEADMDIKINYY